MDRVKKSASQAWSWVREGWSNVTVEPLMLLDGLAFSSIHVYMENLQVERVCRVSEGLSEEVCNDLTSHPDASVVVQQKFSVFALYNGIIAAALPLFFILFMGAWSDKYGRKVPLLAVQLGHVLHAAGYLVVALSPSWPAEILLLVTLLDSLGGGAVSFLTAANSYIGDVSSEASRTSRVGLANSIWFLGGPMGTLLGSYIYTWGGYMPLFATSLTMSTLAVLYVVFCLPESHGPFVKVKTKEGATQDKTKVDLRNSVAVIYGLEVKTQSASSNAPALSSSSVTVANMVKDFFNPRRIVDSFRSTLRQREGNTRALLLIVIFTSLLRRLTRSPYVFAFTRHVLGWKASDYSLWVTYKNLVATTGSLVAVPLLSGRLGMGDNKLALVGAMSGVLEYILYGCASSSRESLIWVGPMGALLLNSCTIAQRAMITKFVGKDEVGKVSAVMGSLDGLMPMVNSALYTAVYHVSVSSFPAAHFFLGASANVLMILAFCLVMLMDKTQQYDVESAKPRQESGPITNKSFLKKTDSCWETPDPIILSTEPAHFSFCTPYAITPEVYQYSHQEVIIVTERETAIESALGTSLTLKTKNLFHSLKSSVKELLRPRQSPAASDRSSDKSSSIDRRSNISHLFVNINYVADDVLFPKPVQKTNMETDSSSSTQSSPDTPSNNTSHNEEIIV